MSKSHIAALTAAVALIALPAMPVASAATAAAHAPPAVSVVTTGPARSLGEPTAAENSLVSAVVATRFGPDGARATVWTRARSRAWRNAGVILPDGFSTSYDASAAALPGGPLLLAAGTAPPGACIAGGSVAIADVYPSGRVSGTRLVSDQRGTGNFDDRPAIAAAPGGLIWVAWSQGHNADSCQDVGQDDQMTVAISRDGGARFGPPLTMPAMGGHAAFGARLMPLPGGRAAVSWTETMPAGDEAVLVSVLGPGRQVSTPRIVLRGDAPPLVLPGASFYDFPAGAITALPDGTLVVAAPLWREGRSVTEVAAGTPHGSWRTVTVRPPRGADLLLPGLGTIDGASVLLCAVHYRADDRLGYSAATLPTSMRPTPLTALTTAPAGPGFFEIGEETSMASTPTGLIAPVAVAGTGTATIETLSWAAAPHHAAPATAPPSARQPRHQTGEPAAARAGHPGGIPVWLPAAIAAAVVLAAGAAWAVFRGSGGARGRPARHSRHG